MYAIVVHEALEVVESLSEMIGRGRDKDRGVWSIVRGPNPIRCFPELPWLSFSPPDSTHQDIVYFPYQAQAEWQLGQAVQPMVHCGDIVSHLTYVGTVG